LPCSFIASSPNPGAVVTVLTAVAIAVLLSLVLGAWNGFLVSVVGIQPIIATLVLMTAGRGIAMLITGGQITTINSPPYKRIGSGFWLGVPVAVLIAGGVFAIVATLTAAHRAGHAHRVGRDQPRWRAGWPVSSPGRSSGPCTRWLGCSPGSRG